MRDSRNLRIKIGFLKEDESSKHLNSPRRGDHPRPRGALPGGKSIKMGLPGKLILCQQIGLREILFGKGASIYDVRKIGFFDPLPPCPQIDATSLTKVAYYVCF